MLIHGNQAIVEGAIASGCRFFAGYPITPATEIAEIMAARLPGLDGTFIQMEDEIASIGAVVGASLAGVKAMTATSGPGFSLMQEIIGFSCMAEVPCVIVDVMRGGPSTGLPTFASQGDVMQARWGTHGDHPIIVLAVSSVQDCFDVTVTAFNFSEKYRTPVIILSDEVVAHTREIFCLPDAGAVSTVKRIKPTVPPEWYIPYENTPRGVPPMASFGDGYRYHVTGLVHDVRGYPTLQKDEITALHERLHRKIYQHFKEIQIVKEFNTEDADICLIAYGSVARSCLQAVKSARGKGIKVGLLQLVTLFPFPRNDVEKILRQSKAVIVPEMNLGQISREVKRVNTNLSKVVKLNRYDGSLITPDEILKKIREVA
ncbi:MAG: 2-oxoacid:acceptor oxidoreductase subunit alpha [Desulfobacterales bacterium]|nr:2-oxoacid:acceptor oxidoreductase subunit alpha [Desulfobacterales bacterium]MDD4072307.1 2-oxoacid:acceptor oxidoreductase subunit alpha [Desulfobacterales bacterium]MDD4391314.1 2-oxoacid:acceptor oxidoreductase subunit alpha [Desulfobacterales bacterium]